MEKIKTMSDFLREIKTSDSNIRYWARTGRIPPIPNVLNEKWMDAVRKYVHRWRNWKKTVIRIGTKEVKNEQHC